MLFNYNEDGIIEYGIKSFPIIVAIIDLFDTSHYQHNVISM